MSTLKAKKTATVVLRCRSDVKAKEAVPKPERQAAERVMCLARSNYRKLGRPDKKTNIIEQPVASIEFIKIGSISSQSKVFTDQLY